MKKMKTLKLNDLFNLVNKEQTMSNSKDELLPVINATGNTIGYAERSICHKLGLLHKVVYLIIENFDNKLLIQYRSDQNNKRMDLPVGGHINKSDKSILSALFREAKEELGMKLNKNQLIKIGVYKRYKEDNLYKPKEINHEIRYIYFYKLLKKEQDLFSKRFEYREEKKMVSGIQWLDLTEIIEACDGSRVADGLGATLPHFLIWKINRGT